jgi:hypothetical protein
LVASATPIPSYGATVSGGAVDNVQRVKGRSGLADWWQAICAISPFSTAPAFGPGDLILVALSRPYFEMLIPQLEGWACTAPGQLRLFLRLRAEETPPSLQQSVMPYDARLDDRRSPIPGTQGDFAQRALHHFVRQVLPTAPSGSAQEHAALVRRNLAQLRAPGRLDRDKRTDGEIRELIERHWCEVGGSSSRMLRKLRDELGVACEQGRFKGLFHQVAGARDARLLQ